MFGIKITWLVFYLIEREGVETNNLARINCYFDRQGENCIRVGAMSYTVYRGQMDPLIQNETCHISRVRVRDLNAAQLPKSDYRVSSEA